MNNLHTPHSTLQTHQSGAVLIVVLLFLVLITLAGVMSVRNSSTDLKLATSDQINTVLLQASDNVQSNIEQSTNGDIENDAASKKQYQAMVVNTTGLLGYFIADTNGLRAEDVIEFCYRPREQFFNMNKATVRRGTGKIEPSANAGACDPTNIGDYNSDRATTMTQVSVDNLGAEGYEDKGDFAKYNLQVDTEDTGALKNMFEMTAVSALPAYGNGTETAIKNCFTSSDIQGCLIENDVASKAVVEWAEVYDISESEFCKFYGKTTNPSASANCSK